MHIYNRVHKYAISYGKDCAKIIMVSELRTNTRKVKIYIDKTRCLFSFARRISYAQK